ncbi:MAG TPA: NADPH-dependent FMN reductase [Polyangia bacterium]|nr:NADPH-dependent FMN reductase [Polyangia bacterium]
MGVRILAISGSLRGSSKNTTLLRAAVQLAPAGVELTLYEALGDVPPFNPDLDDLDAGRAPAAVLAFRRALREADGLMICSPEYAHGVSGVMKNALDWLVGSGELEGKPILLLNASPRSAFAHPALLETIRVMGGLTLEGALPAAMAGDRLDVETILARPAIADVLRRAIEAIRAAVAGASADQARMA